MADQYRWDCMGFLGIHAIDTPHIDRLAAEGATFSNAFTTIPLCCPARQSFLTGDTAERIGCLWNYDITLPTYSLDPSVPTWTQSLNASGYETAYIGKWHCSKEYEPSSFGFDRYYGEQDYADFSRTKGYESAERVSWRGGKSRIPLTDSRTHVLAHEAIDAINTLTSRGSDWLLCLEFPEPHLPCYPSEPFYSRYAQESFAPWTGFFDELQDKPRMQKRQLENWNVEDLKWDDWIPAIRSYFGIISQIDDAVGLVVNRIDELGIADDTLIIFTSDHGDMCGSHRMVDKHYVMYDDIMRVPLIMRYPNNIAPGSVYPSFVSHTLDVPRTLMDLTELPQNNNMIGISFLKWLSADETKGNSPVLQPIRDCVTGSFNGAQFGLYTQRMIRTMNHKYVWNPSDVDELYDLNEDPNEINNIIHHPSSVNVRTALAAQLYVQLKKQDDPLMDLPWLRHQLVGESPFAQESFNA